MSTLLIQNGHLIDPSVGLDAPYDVLFRDGVVAAVELPGALNTADTILDARGLILAPGLIDIHVHLREPGQTHKETIASGTAAAAAGGFTSVVAMPNTVPVNDSIDTLCWMLAPERHPKVRVFAMAAATLGSAGEHLSDFNALAQAGAVGFTDDGKPILGDATMRAALVAAARAGRVLSQHAEDPRLSNGAVIHDGPFAFRLGLRGYPATAESSIVERDLRLLGEIEATDKLRPHLHIQHISTELAVNAIRAAKSRGLHVTCEATPHHFALTDAAIGNYDTNAKMNPPLRSERDRQALIAALLDGTIDCIATDHAPHARHEKEVEFERAPNGITGLETALGLAIRILHLEHGMPLSHILRLMSVNPAAILKLPQAGTLAPGSWADAVLFNPAAEWTYSAQASHSKSKNSPFDGHLMQGRVHATIVGGSIVYQQP
jgi:dihydroorotase